MLPISVAYCHNFAGVLPRLLLVFYQLSVRCATWGVWYSTTEAEVCYLGWCGILPLKPRCATWCVVSTTEAEVCYLGWCGILPLKPRCATWGGVVSYH